MSFYTDLQSIADKLISDFGKPMTLKRSTPGVFDPVTGTSIGTVDETIAVTGIVGAFSSEQVGGLVGREDSDGMRVLMTDKRVTLTSSVAPLVTDALVIDGVAHQIVSIIESKPAGTTLVYVVQARAI